MNIFIENTKKYKFNYKTLGIMHIYLFWGKKKHALQITTIFLFDKNKYTDKIQNKKIHLKIGITPLLMAER